MKRPAGTVLAAPIGENPGGCLRNDSPLLLPQSQIHRVVSLPQPQHCVGLAVHALPQLLAERVEMLSAVVASEIVEDPIMYSGDICGRMPVRCLREKHVEKRP